MKPKMAPNQGIVSDITFINVASLTSQHFIKIITKNSLVEMQEALYRITLPPFGHLFKIFSQVSQGNTLS
jgi:hypothetical protein